MIPHELHSAVGMLLRSAGFPADFAAVRLDGGGNNRVFKVEANGRCAALKIYFRHEHDRRDRLKAEFAFARFAWEKAGLRALPRPLAADFAHGLGLYEFVAGCRLGPSDVDGAAVDQALAFLSGLNRVRAAAEDFDPGSEACFTIAAHLATVDRRIARLGTIEGDEPEEILARSFVRDRLEPLWLSVRAQVEAAADGKINDQLPADLRCLSPSDFGFHNAILADDGRLRFIDFEYAGWDDPAKLVGDFFNQVAVPVPLSFVAPFLTGVAGILGDAGGRVESRVRLLLPVYTVKWCCILLNEFHPVGRERRHFAAAAGRDRRAGQLDKARYLLARLDSIPYPC